MAKVTGPLMSMDASGTVAGSITFGKWKGRNYVRQRVIPSNPQTAAQTGVRSSLAGAAALWKSDTATLKGNFETLASQRNISAFNAFTGFTQQQYSKGFGIANNPSPTNAAPTNPPTSINVDADGKYLTIEWTDSSDSGVWANNVYLKMGSAPTAIWPNLIGVIQQGIEKLTIGPLPAGSYTVNLASVSEEGGVSPLGTPATETISS